MSTKRIEQILSIPKSLYVCLRLFHFMDAIKMPILVRYNCKLQSLKGRIKVMGGVKPAMLKVGFGCVGIYDKKYERSILQIDGCIVLRGKATFGHGSRICVTSNGTLSIGDNFNNTAMTAIVCDNNITFGDNVLVSWDTLVMDTDWHAMQRTDTGEIFGCSKPIIIGNNVWLCTRCIILKGGEIADGCIVGASSVVSKHFMTPNTIIVGNPAVEKRHGITRYIERIPQ